MSESKTIHEITPDEAWGLYDDGKAIIVDVREPAEFAVERVKGALLSPLATLNATALPDGKGGKRIIFMCAGGNRSARAALAYIDAGRDEATHIKGGMSAWKASGLPYVGVDPMTGGIKDKQLDKK